MLDSQEWPITFRKSLIARADGKLRYVAQFTFAHDTLMWLVGAFHSIFELAVMFLQFFSDDVCAS